MIFVSDFHAWFSLHQYVERGPHSIFRKETTDTANENPYVKQMTKERQTGEVVYSWHKRGYKIATITTSSLTITEPLKKVPRRERVVIRENEERVLSRNDEERYKPHR